MENNAAYSKVPVKVGFWGNVKNFWLQPITVELTPKEKKVFKEIHDFWNQEIYVENGIVRLRKAQDAQQQEEVKEQADSFDGFQDVNISL